MSRPFRTIRTIGLGASLVLGLGFGGCDKSNGASAKPGDEAPADLSDEDLVKYSADAFSLVATVEAKLTGSGDMNGSLATKFTGRLDVKPHTDGKLHVHGVVDSIAEYVTTGEFHYPDKTVEQLIEELVGEDYVQVVYRLGDNDVEASKALPENVKKREAQEKEAEEAKADAEAKAENADSERPRPEIGVAQFMGMPNLPEFSVAPGETKSVERQMATRNLFGQVEVPVERDTKIEYVGIDESNGSRIATLKVYIEGSGAKDLETSGGNSAFLSILEESDLTVMVDLDSGIPVSVQGYQAFEITFEFQGQEQQVESNTDINATYVPAG
jgi:hypothetical protein